MLRGGVLKTKTLIQKIKYIPVHILQQPEKFVKLTDNKLTIYITSIAGVNPDDNLTYQLIIEFQCQTFIQLT